MNSFLNYMGGKKYLAPFIVSFFPKHSCYCEVFGGAAWCLFDKSPIISETEIYNDINGELVNLFLQIKNNLRELQKKCFWLPSSRELYKKYLAFKPDSLDDIERAVRFLYCLKNSFSGQLVSGYSAGPTKTPSWNTKFVQSLGRIRKRLNNVVIENASFEKIIPQYDTPTTLFYLDPPYFVANNTKYYEYVFTQEEHKLLRELCTKIKGKFILSYENTEEVRNFYKNFYITKTPQVSIVSSTKKEKDKVSELLISNFELKQKQKELF